MESRGGAAAVEHAAHMDYDRLPLQKPARVWAGRGNGERCEVCGRTIHPHEVEYELEFVRPAATYRLHRQCADLWDAERRRRSR